MGKQFLKRLTAAVVAGLMAAGCVNLHVLADELKQAGARPGNTVFEAVQYSAASVSGTVVPNELAADFTSVGGQFEAGNYMTYQKVDFGDGNYNTAMLMVSAPAEETGRQIEIRLDASDGALIATVPVEATGDTMVFKEQYASISEVTGVHDVYLVFPQEANLNIDWFTFSSYNGTETQEEFDARMKWWRDAKYGQFIHWGAYAYLGGEYKGQRTGYAEWIMDNLKISKEDYAAEVAKKFNPTQFNAAEVVKLAKDAGQEYIMFTSRHHEGFSMFDTKIRDFKDYGLMSYGDYQGEDPVMQLSQECKRQGVTFGAYYTIMDWHDKSQSNWGANMDASQKADFVSRMKGQLRELIETYGVEVFFFDGEWPGWWTKQDGQELYRYLRTISPDLIINNRVGKRHVDDGDYGTPEQEIPSTGLDYDWESCMTLNGTWGYNKFDNNWKNANTVITNLVNCASKGGNYLLNIGPDEEGRVPQQSQDILREAGAWLSEYGDSVYNTRRSCFTKLPSGVQATTKEGKIYLHLSKITNTDLLIPKIQNEITGIKVMGTNQNIEYLDMKNNIVLDLSGVTANPYDTVIEMDVVGMPAQVESPGEVNIALQATEVKESNYYRNDPTYSGSKAVDGSIDTRWATDDNTSQATLELTFAEPVTVNTAYLSQYTSQTNWTKGYTIDYWDGTQWVPAYTGGEFDKETTVTFDPVTSDKIRLNITDASNPSYSEFQLFNREQLEVEITQPVTTPATGQRPEGHSLIGAAPFTVAGTAKGGTSVDIKITGNDFTPAVFSTEIAADGTWSKEIDQNFTPGAINISAMLKDADGDIVAVTTTSAIVRGKVNLAQNKPVTVSSYYTQLPGYNGDAAVDGIVGTRWAPSDDDKQPVMTIDLGEMTTFNQILISEMFDTWNLPNDYRCRSFQIEYFDGAEWKTAYEGERIGELLTIDLPQAITASQVRLTILESREVDGKVAATNIIEFELYYIPDEPQPTDTDKTILNKVIAKAEALLGTDEFNNAIQSVQDSFQAVLAEAQKVAANEAATQAQIDAAWVSLMTEIHKLGLQQGNKDLLREHVELYSQLDLDLYIDGSAKDNFVAALEAAKAMLENNDAVQSEVDAADDALVAAAQALEKTRRQDHPPEWGGFHSKLCGRPLCQGLGRVRSSERRSQRSARKPERHAGRN